MVGLMNIFGFGLVRTESFRLWLGPQLGLNTYALNYERKLRDSINVRYSISNGIASSNININLLERKVEGLFFGPSLGLSLGMNFNFAAPVTLSIEMSARLIYYNGVEARSSIILINSLTVPFVQFSYNSWQSYLKFNLNATIAILYRFDEGFLLKKTEPENK